jgi:hypothetical protein
MKPMFLAAAIALSASACTPSHGDAAAGAGGGLSETECRAVLDHGRELMGMPADVTSDALEAELHTCADEGTLSQAEYDCGMAATSMPEYGACGIDLD